MIKGVHAYLLTASFRLLGSLPLTWGPMKDRHTVRVDHGRRSVDGVLPVTCASIRDNVVKLRITKCDIIQYGVFRTKF